MDDQIRGRGRTPDKGFRRTRPPARPASRPLSTLKPDKPKDEHIIDLYDDVPKNAPDLRDQEVEELKKLAQSDVLKAYAWSRKQLAKLGQKLQELKSKITPKRQKLLKISAVALPALALAFNFAPGIYQSLTDRSDILGETQNAPDFDTLESESTSSQPLVFDPDAGVAVYQDNISGVVATISQQSLPPSLEEQGGPEGLALSLDDKITINQLQSSKGTIYVAVSSRDTNTVIFSYQDLLIFIRTNGLVDNDTWIEYVDGLR